MMLERDTHYPLALPPARQCDRVSSFSSYAGAGSAASFTAWVAVRKNQGRATESTRSLLQTQSSPPSEAVEVIHPEMPTAGTGGARALPCSQVSIRRSPFWRNRSRMLKPVDPHDGLEGIDGAASAVGLVGVVHADFGGFGEWPERCGVLPVAGLVVCDFHGVA